eukprot:CAMPEP_0197177062 /NCGR_PEP_ID=MMETSP1423-20130617/2799_1 /TAXON_ID=476441 /ORGANISM="Pseudo-nitzschia heimii, Strain UNC1101" /LENGTH=598 /DNA_ID=CAMNT_0042626545 /DNA_START=162 /DNA_END=1958 /DNA_ORIENTATION=+
MSTVVLDLPPEDVSPRVKSSNNRQVGIGGQSDGPNSLSEYDEALARKLQAEWDADGTAAVASGSETPTASNAVDSIPSFRRRLGEPTLGTTSTTTTTTTKKTTVKVAKASNAWGFDVEQSHCASCSDEFNPFNRRHHCRLCGKIFCHKCSDQRTLIPPSAIVLTPSKGGKKARPPTSEDHLTSFTPDPDPDRMLTYIDEDKQLLYGKGLEERFQLAREPLRVCAGCHEQLQPLQEELRTTNSNAMRFNHIDPTNRRRFFNSPLAFTLGHEVRKAAYTLNNMLPLPKRMGSVIMGVNEQYNLQNVDTFPTGEDLELQQCRDECATIVPNLSNLDGIRIPARLLEDAKGVAVLTVAKGGFGMTGMEFGTGLVVARLGDDRWSAPCAIGTAGLSWGALIGAQVSDHVFLLMTDAAVELMFHNEGNLQLGADVGVVVGPVGRALEADFAASPGSAAPIYTYSLSKGIYAGISLDGKVIVTRNRVNEKFYGREITGQELLSGDIPSPPAARPLYDALHRCHVYAKNDAGCGGGAAAAFLNRPETRVMHGYPELFESAYDDPRSVLFPDRLRRTTRREPDDRHQHDSERSYATDVSDITSNPGY